MNAVPLADSPGNLQAQIAGLWIYPIKSCAGIACDAVALTDTGLAHDREWMVVDAQGDMLTQRQLPRMALIQPAIDDHGFCLHAPGMAALALPLHVQTERVATPVRVWQDEVPAFDEGLAASDWLSRFLLAEGPADITGPLRLVRFDARHRRPSSAQWCQGHAAQSRFSDGFAVLVVSQASLDELNARLRQQSEAAVDMRRFRPNLVLAGDAWQAHDEDRVDQFRIHSAQGDAVLLPVKPCPRCPIPDIDPDRAVSHPSVSRTLQTYRQDARVNGAITFGMNAIPLAGCGTTLRLGDVVMSDWAF